MRHVGRAEGRQSWIGYAPRRISDLVALAFISRIEEHLVLADRPAQRGPELLQVDALLLAVRKKGIFRIENIGAAKGVGRSVKAVGSGLQTDIGDRPGLKAIFRLGILLRLEFLNGVDG